MGGYGKAGSHFLSTPRVISCPAESLPLTRLSLPVPPHGHFRSPQGQFLSSRVTSCNPTVTSCPTPRSLPVTPGSFPVQQSYFLSSRVTSCPTPQSLPVTPESIPVQQSHFLSSGSLPVPIHGHFLSPHGHFLSCHTQTPPTPGPTHSPPVKVGHVHGAHVVCGRPHGDDARAPPLDP